jgi:thymidylate synthase (FAD)
MKVELVETLGTDLTVVNAARVSFNKHKENFDEKDEKLIAFLAKHGHWTPFGHPQLQLRISAPVFVARQLVKHQVGLVWNEVSRRYVDTPPSFYSPKEWRERAVNKKQGSGEGVINIQEQDVQKFYGTIIDFYAALLKQGVAPEQARMILPQSMYTEWYWTGSLFAFSRVCNLRMKEDAQEETSYIARQIHELIKEVFPISWKHLVNI